MSLPAVFRAAPIALWLAAGIAAAHEEPRIVPRPAKVDFAKGEFAIPAWLTVADARGEFARRLRQACGKTVVSAEADVANIVFAARDTTVAHPPESYALEVSPKRMTVLANDDAGFVHGASSLIQLLCTGQPIPAMRIEDAPQFKWRGVMLDSARHYQTPEYIQRFLDTMALHKLNVLHWHLTDDQAWRLEIKKYPRLTEVGAWRVNAGEAALADIDEATGKPRLYGGFYTQDTVRGLVSHAQKLGITIVPEIEMPGHASAAIAAYPQLGALAGSVTQVPADWGIYPNAFAINDATFAFLEDVLRETMQLFASPYIHVGGDEVEPTQWIAAGERGDGHAIQARFTNRIAQFVHKSGRVMVGWDEILSPGLAKNAVVMSWRGIDGAVQAAAQGHDTILSAWPTLYFDNRPYASLDGPPGRVKVVSLRDVYEFDPLPASIDASQRSHVLGVQGNLWVEHIRTQDRLDYMAWPRAAAIAELGWTPAKRRDYDNFAMRLGAVYPLYDALGVKYAKPGAPLRQGRDERSSRELALCGEAIPIVIEDDGPVHGERATFAVDLQNPCWLFKDADLSGVTGIDARVGQIPFNYQIGAARQKIAFARADAPALEVRLGTCEGKLLASVPVQRATDYGVSSVHAHFAPAATSSRVQPDDSTAIRATEARSPAGKVDAAARGGRNDLCLRFAQPTLDPMWTIDRVRLVRP